MNDLIKKLVIIPVNKNTGRSTASSKNIYAIGYTGLNDNDGVFAVGIDRWKYPGKDEQFIIDFYSGDDGSWWKIASFDSHWIWDIIILLTHVLRLVKEK
jgi:hypothetical protein